MSSPDRNGILLLFSLKSKRYSVEQVDAVKKRKLLLLIKKLTGCFRLNYCIFAIWKQIDRKK